MLIYQHLIGFHLKDKNPAAVQALFLQAGYYENLAKKYHPPGDTVYRWHRLRAKEILERAAKENKVKSEGWIKSYNLLQEIGQPTFSFEVENVNIPGQPLWVTSGEYGSFSGKFTLPQNVLNGNFSIYANGYGNSVWFSVEEYKRPKFSVEFDKVKESYKLDDSIKITGFVKAYAGNVVDGAKVVYRVVRQHWDRYQRRYPASKRLRNLRLRPPFPYK